MRPHLHCAMCGQTPEQLPGYIDCLEPGQTASDYCWEEEGTLNRETGLFLCDTCYIKAGQPSSSRGWKVPLHWHPDF